MSGTGETKPNTSYTTKAHMHQ